MSWSDAWDIAVQATRGDRQLELLSNVGARERSRDNRRIVTTATSSTAVRASPEMEQHPVDAPLTIHNIMGNCLLAWDTSFNTGMNLSKARRFAVRDETLRKVKVELKLNSWGVPAPAAWKLSTETLHFVDCKQLPRDQPGALAGGRHLLGRFDSVMVTVSADFDHYWLPIRKETFFRVLHAAAVNLSGREFKEFCRPGGRGLDESKYLKAMRRIFDNVLAASASACIKHLVMFPFGMGAFLRHLNTQLGCGHYIGDADLQFRKRIADEFIAALCAAPMVPHVHFCLALGSAAIEPQANAEAWVRAFHGAPGNIRAKVTMVLNGDCLHLAHTLAEHSEACSVMMVNGANRSLLGNHWFGNHALQAIDENIHRRSSLMAAASYVLNSFTTANRQPRQGDALERNVTRAGGAIKRI